MDKRYIAVYLLAAVCVYIGVSMMVSPGGDEAARGAGAGAAGVVEVDPTTVLDGDATGYMGTGMPQIKLVEEPDWPLDQRPPRRPSTMDPDREYDGNARSEELDRVLQNLGGMDVYVEGVDGPVQTPQAPKKR